MLRLHKGIYSCPEEVAIENDTTGIVNYCLKGLTVLLQNNISPVFVFDGAYFPGKKPTEISRSTRRQKAMEKLVQLYPQIKKIQENNVEGFLPSLPGLDGEVIAPHGSRQLSTVHSTSLTFRQRRDLCVQATQITPKMAADFIQELRKRRIKYIVAPYEADAQMAYLIQNHFVDFIISEDSDCIPFGCQRILFKLDYKGGKLHPTGELLDLADLQQNDPADLDLRDFSQDMIQNMCILAGCDYAKSLDRIGIKKAFNLVKRYKRFDAILCAIRREGKISVRPNYLADITEAKLCFKYQRVFSNVIDYTPENRSKIKLVHLSPINQEVKQAEFGPSLERVILKSRADVEQTSDAAFDFLGPMLDPNCIFEIASGRIDPDTRKPIMPLEDGDSGLGPPAHQPIKSQRAQPKIKQFFSPMGSSAYRNLPTQRLPSTGLPAFAINSTRCLQVDPKVRKAFKPPRGQNPALENGSSEVLKESSVKPRYKTLKDLTTTPYQSALVSSKFKPLPIPAVSDERPEKLQYLFKLNKTEERFEGTRDVWNTSSKTVLSQKRTFATVTEVNNVANTKRIRKQVLSEYEVSSYSSPKSGEDHVIDLSGTVLEPSPVLSETPTSSIAPVSASIFVTDLPRKSDSFRKSLPNTLSFTAGAAAEQCFKPTGSAVFESQGQKKNPFSAFKFTTSECPDSSRSGVSEVLQELNPPTLHRPGFNRINFSSSK